MLLLSDGIDNASEGGQAPVAAAASAKALGLPLYTRAYGSKASGKDISIEAVSPRQLAFVGQTVTLKAAVRHRGLEGGVAAVTLYSGKSAIEKKDAALAAGRSSGVSFEIKCDKPGVYPYQVEVSPVPDEITRLNNRTDFSITVVDDAIKVLVLEGKPYWDFRFLLQALSRDEAVAVTAAVRVKDGRVMVRDIAATNKKTASTPGSAATLHGEDVKIANDPARFLEDAESLGKYTVVILGRDVEAFLTPEGLANLKEWVARTGGTVLCARGRPTAVVSEKLDPIMPLTWSDASEGRLRVKLTPLGEALSWFPRATSGTEETLSDKMPSVASSHPARSLKPLASVVAVADSSGDMDDMPVISYLPYGAGRTVVMEMSGMWRWSFLPARYDEYQDVYPYFWASLIRWMVTSADFLPSQTAAVKSARSTFTTREKAVFFVMLRPEEKEFNSGNPPVLEMRKEGTGEPVLVTAAPAGKDVGFFRAVAGPLEEGFYEARLKRGSDGPPAQCVFSVQPPLQEQLELAARPEYLARLAAEAGGEDVTATGIGRIRGSYADYWMRTHPARQSSVTAWDRMWVMLLAVVIWATAWVVRRRGGLI